MIKISNEVKVGAVALLTLIAFIWLYNFLKGKDYFKSTVNYYAIYNDIGGLEESSPVEVNGYKVGVIQSIRFVNPVSGRLLVKFSVNKGFKLPRNTVAEVIPVSLIAGMKVHFVYGKGPGFYSDGDTIPGRLSTSIITKLEEELVPVKEKVTKLLGVLDSVVRSINEIMDPGFRKDLRGTISNLNSTSKSFDNIIGSKEKDLKAALESISKFSQMLSDNSGKMSKTFSNLETITDSLAAADIYTSVTKLKSSIEETAGLLKNLNDGKGTAGQFLTNDSVYLNLTRSLESLDLLLRDMKANPKRYVHFSVFGKKNIPAN